MDMGKRTKPALLSIALLGLLAAGACGSGNGAVPADAAVTSNGTTGDSDGASTSGQDRPAPGMAWVIFGADTVHAEVASVPAQREQGLMDRPEVPAGTGMLFVFPDNTHRSFWMKNTLVALDIAFMNESFQVVDIKQMEALDENFTDSDEPAKFALEVMQGWFATQGIEEGATAQVVFGPGLRVR